jgi:hypothetical protein
LAEREEEGGAGFEAAFSPDTAAVLPDDALDEGEAGVTGGIRRDDVEERGGAARVEAGAVVADVIDGAALARDAAEVDVGMRDRAGDLKALSA